jgi:hypothetical protein
MKDAYVNAFRTVLIETQNTMGITLSVELEAYVSMLLASRIDRVDIIPPKGFGVTYLELCEYPNQNAKELGDTCLFVSGVFPYYGKKHKISKSYYTNIGISSYEIAAQVFGQSMFADLAKNFDFLCYFIENATGNQRVHGWLNF